MLRNALKICVPVLVSAAFIVLLVILVIRWKESPAVKDSLAEANELIVLGEYDSALGMLEGVLLRDPNPRSVREYLRLHLAVASSLKDYKILLEASVKAVQAFGDSKRYWSYRVLAESRLGLHDAALMHGEEYLPRRRYGGILTEIYLAAGKTPEPDILPGRYEELLMLPDRDSPDDYIAAGDTFNSPDLKAQAVVLTATQRGTAEAFNMITPAVRQGFPEIAMYAAYDSQHFDEAYNILSENPSLGEDPSTVLLKADIYLLNGMYRSAREVYERFIMLYPGESTIPYHNLSRLQHGFAGSLEYLQRGLEWFPGSRGLAMSRITLLMEYGKDTEAENLLKIYLRETPGDDFAVLLEDYLGGKPRTPDVYTSRLWLRIDEAGSAAGKTAAYTAWYLAAGGQYDELELFLHRSEKERGNTPWHRTFTAVLHALEGRYDLAEDYFNLACELDRTPENLYNAAIIKNAFHDYEASISLLSEALAEAETGKRTARHEAVIGAELASRLAAAGRREEALEYLREAAKKDPGNLNIKRIETKILERN